MFDLSEEVCYTEAMISEEKLKILTNGAKYDVSCSSSGSGRKNEGGIGNGMPDGCCHSFTPDGRCVSLLKILMSNDCVFDCKYCMSRRSCDVPRATASPEEICELTVDFYKRNYIEGLFLSSAVHISPDHTMEMLVRTVYLLRTRYQFHGYVHLKGIPKADPLLVSEAAKYADRMSYNMELPSEQSLKLLAPQKSKESLLLPMKQLQRERALFKAEKHRGFFLPAGQTTQMIVGASPERDGQILRLTESLYRVTGLKRVYYSSYTPVVEDSLLPSTASPALREHRLYQADWLLRFYGFDVEELVPEEENLPLDVDPKCAWALRNMHLFPVEVNRAPLEALLRVPGIGARSAQKILSARRYTALTFEHLKKMRVVLKRARHFITVSGKFYGEEHASALRGLLASAEATHQLSLFDSPAQAEPSAKAAQQMSLFDSPALPEPSAAYSALTGEL